MKRFNNLAFVLAVIVVMVCLFSGCGKTENEIDANGTTEKVEITVANSFEMNDEDEPSISESMPSSTEKPTISSMQKNEKQQKEDSKSINSKTNVSPKNEAKNNQPDIVYVVDGELEYNNSKYYVSNSKLNAEKAGKKITLSDQNCAENITIYNNEIYYSVINSQNTVEWGREKLTWNNCSCWKMKLDGSGKVKVFDFAGCGHIIYIDDENIYYVGDTARDGYYQYAKAHNSFFKYNKATQKSIEIITTGGLKFADPVYVGGKFLYSSSQNGFCRYDTKTESTKELKNSNGELLGIPQDTIAYDGTTAYFSDWGDAIYIYNSKDDSVKTVCELGDDYYGIRGKGDGYLILSAKDDTYKEFNLNSKTISDIK